MFEYNEEFKSFIFRNKNCAPAELLLKYKGGKDMGFDIEYAVCQIECRRKTVSKLKPFVDNDNFVFPDSISSEQASDYRVARYHSNLVGTGRTVLDMTAGLGIDALTICMAGNKVCAVELDENKSRALLHNSSILKVGDFEVLNTDSVDFIRHIDRNFDIVFIDPARRKADKSRAYSFRDCTPDVLEIYDSILDKCDTLMIKASPLLDINEIRKEIDSIDSIHVVSVKGECKEVLVVVRKGASFKSLTAVNLDDNGIVSSYSIDGYDNSATRFVENESLEGCQYLYEPDASVMKLNCGGELCRDFPGLMKLSANSQIYVSNEFYSTFPGRRLKIEKIADKKYLKTLKGEKMNVVCRNYNIGAPELRKKLGLKEGDDTFLYASKFGMKEKPVVIICSIIR